MAIHSPGREERRGDPNARVKRYLSYVLAVAAGIGDAVRGRGDPYYTSQEPRWYVSVLAGAALLISLFASFWLEHR
jgi:hypothetical protein